jgi:uncharacterized protein
VTEIDLEAPDEYLMSDTSPDDCMLLSEMDGFLTGIVVGPEPVPQSEWMPVIWGGEESEFDSEQQGQVIHGTIMGRYNEIVATMRNDPDSFEPIFYEAPDGTLIVTAWAAGFLDAVKLRRQAWEPLVKHRRANILLMPLIILGDDEASSAAAREVVLCCEAQRDQNLRGGHLRFLAGSSARSPEVKPTAAAW